MTGRPTKYNVGLGNRILKHYSDGKTILSITKIKGMPSRNTIYLWRTDFPEFGKAYIVACECNADSVVESRYEALIDADVSEAKLASEQWKAGTWLASKINRSKYGDKLDIQHSVTIDLSPALIEATQRMASVGMITPALIETQAKEL